MPPPHPTLADPKSWTQPSLHRHYLVQLMWNGLKVEVITFKPQAPTLPSVPRHEARM